MLFGHCEFNLPRKQVMAEAEEGELKSPVRTSKEREDGEVSQEEGEITAQVPRSAPSSSFKDDRPRTG
jgi:hypothetical protein